MSEFVNKNKNFDNYSEIYSQEVNQANISAQTKSSFGQYNKLIGITKNSENVFKGPRGGIFYINSNGGRTYIKEFKSF